MKSSRQPLTRSARSIKAIVNKKVLVPVAIQKTVEKSVLNIQENNTDIKNIQKKKKGKESKKQGMNNDN